MKFNKRQFFILALTVVVCFAVYVNWKLTKTEVNTELNNTSSTTEKTLGEAKFVNKDESGQLSSGTLSQSEYFSIARLNKKKAREESLALLKTITDGEKNDAQVKVKALEDTRRIALAAEKEDRIESLIKAKGFKDCVALIGDKNINIIVSNAALKPTEVAIIKDIAINETGLTSEKVIIIEMK